jgi:hypothetical protein
MFEAIASTSLFICSMPSTIDAIPACPSFDTATVSCALRATSEALSAACSADTLSSSTVIDVWLIAADCWDTVADCSLTEERIWVAEADRDRAEPATLPDSSERPSTMPLRLRESDFISPEPLASTRRVRSPLATAAAKAEYWATACSSDSLAARSVATISWSRSLMALNDSARWLNSSRDVTAARRLRSPPAIPRAAEATDCTFPAMRAAREKAMTRPARIAAPIVHRTWDRPRSYEARAVPRNQWISSVSTAARCRMEESTVRNRS